MEQNQASRVVRDGCDAINPEAASLYRGRILIMQQNWFFKVHVSRAIRAMMRTSDSSEWPTSTLVAEMEYTQGNDGFCIVGEGEDPARNEFGRVNERLYCFHRRTGNPTDSDTSTTS